MGSFLGQTLIKAMPNKSKMKQVVKSMQGWDLTPPSPTISHLRKDYVSMLFLTRQEIDFS